MELKHGWEDTLIEKYYLLIVPYGIETAEIAIGWSSIGAFNRTLWN